MAFSFLHLADVHLDTAFASRHQQLRSLLRQSLRQAFQRAIDTAIDLQLDAVLVSGDLFDNDTLSFATERFLIQELCRLQQAGIRLVYAPGNHDPYGVGYRCHEMPWPDNVHVFTASLPDFVTFETENGDPRAVIVGAAHHSQREAQNLARCFPPVDSQTVPHIAMLHCVVTGSAGSESHDRYAPCEMQDLVDKGYVYWALGHVHKPQQLADEPYIVYPGNIMGRHPGETGPRGGCLVNIDKQQVSVEFLPLSPVYWADVVVTGLQDCRNLMELEQHIVSVIEKHLSQQASGMRPLVRATLSGPSPLASELRSSDNLAVLTDSIQSALDLDYLEFEVKGIVHAANPQQYLAEPHVLGKALQLWQQALQDDAVLERIAPEIIAGISNRDGKSKKVYLRELLQGLDYELVARLLKEEQR